MTLFTKLALAIAYKPPLGSRILHIDFACTDKKVIRVDAVIVIATMTGIMIAYINASKLQRKVRGLPIATVSSDNRIFFLSASNGTQPDPATGVRLRNAISGEERANVRLDRRHGGSINRPLGSSR
jgi:hypothetical protein